MYSRPSRDSLRRSRDAWESRVRVRPIDPVPPHLAQQLLLREHARAPTRASTGARTPSRRAPPIAGDGRAAGRPVDRDLGDVDPIHRRQGGSPQDGADAGEQLLVVERLRHVVVHAAGERAHPVDGIAVFGEQDHRDVTVPRAARLALPQAAAEVEAACVQEELVEETRSGLVSSARSSASSPACAPSTSKPSAAIGARGTRVWPARAPRRGQRWPCRRRYQRPPAAARCPFARLCDEPRADHAVRLRSKSGSTSGFRTLDCPDRAGQVAPCLTPRRRARAGRLAPRRTTRGPRRSARGDARSRTRPRRGR